MEIRESVRTLLWGIGLSLVMHGLFGALVTHAPRLASSPAERRPPGKVAIKVRPTPPPPPPAPPPPPPPKPKEKPKPPKPMANKANSKATPSAAPIQGLTKESLATTGKGSFSAPVGNTLMVPDEGQRVTDAAPLDSDLSSDPKLLTGSVKIPEYTDAALEAAYEGKVIVEVYVDESGAVTQVEPQKKIGFGMDERIQAAAMTAKFSPRRNRYGKAEPGWAKITFNLQVP